MTGAAKDLDGMDAIWVEVIANQIMGVAEEMASTLIRASFSPNIKQRADCSTAVLAPNGDVLAQAPRIPIHLGSMIGAIEHLLHFHPLDTLSPGDMFLANDPYTGGGQHLPDINFVAPVFFEGRVAAFVANIAHHADVGGMVAGSESSICQTIFQEGIRLPPVAIVRGGVVNRDIQEIITLNSRTPEERHGDILAQIAANTVGVRRLTECMQRYGHDRVIGACNHYLDATERRFRARLADIPDGVFEAADALDPDLYGNGETVPIKLRLEKKGTELILDFEGTGPQLPSARNLPVGALHSTIYCVVKILLDPDLPANSGYFRAITVKTPEGTVVSPSPGAAVGARALASAVVGDVVASTLSQMVPESAVAGSGPHHQATFSGTYPSGGVWVDYETFAGAQGARPYQDGMDAVRIHASGASNLPVEALEHAYPLIIERYALRDDSGGAGHYRGGCGLIRDYRALSPMTVSLSAERQAVAPRGVDGGRDGATGAFVLNPGRSGERRLPSAVGELAMAQGDVLSIRTPGGAGFGDPDRRDPALLEKDIREGRVTKGGAGL
ncbi:hydantoinase B/oxoprolinase family protein [Fodinicurvata sp. EGI_FJ10296]|uniref:hydantoinase B/oxoprolinase family protein n=1 Tax=Fodinicurvata sp. EGI_FJ10296 TaxID=3231908 RepID=UPI0034525478